MLAASITISTLSDLSTVVPSAATPAAGGFTALLNVGNGSDAFGNNSGGLANNGGNSSSNLAINNLQSPPASTLKPASFGGSSADQGPPSPPQQAASHFSANTNNNQTQNPPAAPPAQASQAPASSPQASSTGNQNTDNSAPAQTGSGSTQSDNTSNNDIAQAGQQLRTQIKNQLGDISQILLSMIQALSVTPVQPLQPVVPNVTAQVSSPASTLPADPGGQQNAGAAPTDQEISLLKDMQSLLQQMQQSLSGQGSQGNQNSPNNLQTISDALAADMAQLSQLRNAPVNSNNTANGNNAPVAFTETVAPISNLGDALKSSIAQIRAQLQSLQSNNEAIFTQAITNLSSAPVSASDTAPKGTQDNSVLTNTTPVVLGGNPPAPVAQDTSPVANALSNPLLPAQGNLSQGGGSTGGGNQNSSQDQLTQPTVAAVSPSSTSPTDPAGGASFTKILSQVSQSDVLDQVKFQVKTALADGSSKITIQLNPPELGKVDVKLDISADGKASGVTITATNQGTLDLLQRDVQGLTRALNDAGLTTDSGSLNFSLSGGQQNQTQAGSQQAATSYRQAQPEEEEPVINAISRSYVVNLATGLDITI